MLHLCLHSKNVVSQNIGAERKWPVNLTCLFNAMETAQWPCWLFPQQLSALVDLRLLSELGWSAERWGKQRDSSYSRQPEVTSAIIHWLMIMWIHQWKVNICMLCFYIRYWTKNQWNSCFILFIVYIYI